VRLVGKFKKKSKQQVSSTQKQEGKSEKTSPKLANLHENTPKFRFAVN